ncbi:MAG: hypothetical protein AB1805_07015 [Nitrospirota bacterium]
MKDRGRGVSICVGGSPEADYCLKSRDEVALVLERLLAVGGDQNSGTPQR